jgi:hypothetical protein
VRTRGGGLVVPILAIVPDHPAATSGPGNRLEEARAGPNKDRSMSEEEV